MKKRNNKIIFNNSSHTKLSDRKLINDLNLSRAPQKDNHNIMVNTIKKI